MDIELLYFNHNCNSYLLKYNNECALIDPGNNNNNCLLNYIKNKGLSLKAIYLTHGHYDHIEGLLTIKDVPIYLHEKEEKVLTSQFNNCSFMSENKFVIENRDLHFLEDEEIIKIFDEEVKVIHTPFHTSGCLCFYFPKHKLLISGDTLFFHAIGRSDLPTSEPRFIEKSLKKLFLLPHEVDNDTQVFPGHGPKTTLSKEYRFYKKEYNL